MAQAMTQLGAGPHRALAGLGLALAILSSGCPQTGSQPSAALGERPAADASGATRAIGAAPVDAPRIVSLSPLATRFLIQLGLEDQLVALKPEPAEDADRSGGPPDLAAAARLEPDFVFLPALPDDRTELAELEAVGARIVEFAPHDLEDLLALCQGIGVELAGREGVEAFERRVLRPVALIAGQSPPTNRLRALALIGLDPPEIAGGHSFETDLIQVAGASSLTHGADDARRPIDRAGLAALEPDLILVMTEAALTPEQHEQVLDLTYGIAPVHAFPFRRELFWLDEPVREATRLRELIVAAERERAASARP